MTEKPPILAVEGLSRIFTRAAGLLRGKEQMRAVDNLSLALRPGETLGIVGESGCGKTTLGRLILGLIDPSGGEIEFDGQKIKNFENVLFRLRHEDFMG